MGVVLILKSFYLPKSYNSEKGHGAINDLNNLLNDVGVTFNVSKKNNGQKLFISVDEQKLKDATTHHKAGRPVEHKIDFSEIEQMKLSGKTNKQIYSELGISKSLFYLKMKEYKNNIGQK